MSIFQTDNRNSCFYKLKLSVAFSFVYVLTIGISNLQAANILRGYVDKSLVVDSLKDQNIESTDGAACAKSDSSENNNLRKDSFSKSFIGVWQCITEVVDSEVETIYVGQQVSSFVSFVPNKDGRVLAHFQQEGWSEATSSVSALSETKFVMDKTNYYLANGNASKWVAKSQDSYILKEQNKIVSTGKIAQYIDGHFVGYYQTRSILIKVSNEPNLLCYQ